MSVGRVRSLGRGLLPACSCITSGNSELTHGLTHYGGLSGVPGLTVLAMAEGEGSRLTTVSTETTLNYVEEKAYSETKRGVR